MKLLDIVSTNRVAFRLTATDKESVLADQERCFMQDGDIRTQSQSATNNYRYTQRTGSLSSTGLAKGSPSLMERFKDSNLWPQ